MNKGCQGHIFFNNTSFERYHAVIGNGGAIATTLAELEEVVFNDSKFNDSINYTLSFCTFYKNSAASNGGAISSTGIVIIIESSNFSSNHALYEGGALLLISKLAVLKEFISQDNLVRELFGDGGGAIVFSGYLLLINQSLIYTNEAGIGGGGGGGRHYQSSIITEQEFIYHILFIIEVFAMVVQ